MVTQYSSMAVSVKVVIVGSGMAGAAAAERLHRGGIRDFVVLEAQDRVGGRVQTLWLSEADRPREKIELGANWIHHMFGNPMYDLATTYGLLNMESSSNFMRSSPRQVAGFTNAAGVIERVPNAVINEVYRQVATVLDKSVNLYPHRKELRGEMADLGLDTYVQQELEGYLSGFQGRERSVREFIVRQRLNWETAQSGCHDMDEVSALEFGGYKEYSGPDITIPSGFQSVVRCLLKPVKDNVLLEHAVEKIELHAVVREDSPEISTMLDIEPAEQTISSNGHPYSLDKCDIKPSFADSSAPRTGNGIHVEDDNNFQSAANEFSNVLLDGDQVEERPCVVTCTNGRMYYADHVIFTGSINHLKENISTLFQPQLPAWKSEAITRLSMGVVNKIFMEFPNLDFMGVIDHCKLFPGGTPCSRTATDDNLSESWVNKISIFYVEPTESGKLLIFWITGDEAIFMEGLSEEEVRLDMMKFLRLYLQTDIPEPTRIIRTQWHSNPYTRGSYSFVPVGSQTEYMEILAEPLRETGTDKPLLLFAGEATHPSFYSTTHGALLSGRREAERLLQWEGLLPGSSAQQQGS